MEQNAFFFFKSLDEIAFLNTKLQNETKRKAANLDGLLNGLLPRQAKTRYFKGILQKSKGFKFGPRFQKSLKYN